MVCEELNQRIVYVDFNETIAIAIILFSGYYLILCAVLFSSFVLYQSTSSSPVLRRTASAHNLFRGDLERADPERADSGLSSRRNSLTDETIRVNCLVPIVIKRPEDIANQIDRRCRVLFPISFLITNVIYWTTLGVLSSKVD